MRSVFIVVDGFSFYDLSTINLLALFVLLLLRNAVYQISVDKWLISQQNGGGGCGYELLS